MRRPSMSTISNRQSWHSNLSPTAAMMPPQRFCEGQNISGKRLMLLAPRAGFEPATIRLTVSYIPLTANNMSDGRQLFYASFY